jgi:hypothetical protein
MGYAGSPYRELFNSIGHWLHHLNRLIRLINDAKRPGSRTGRERDIFDADSLAEILGDSRETVTDCQQLLQKAQSVGLSISPMHNLIVSEEAERLILQTEKKHIKLSLLVRSLEMDLRGNADGVRFP